MSHTEFFVLLLGVALAILLQLALLLRGRSNGAGGLALFQQDLQKSLLQERQHSLDRMDRLEREVRMQLQASAQGTRQELSASLAQFHSATLQQLDALKVQMQQQAQSGRQEQAQSLTRFADTMNQTLANLTESNAQRMLEVRATLESKMRELQTDNGTRLEEMRRTVDEKLHATLETRLTESFRQVSERLERVHQGLGEMQQLAIGVGDLKRVLTNVKTRGTWGEVQLEMLLEQVLTVDQYAKNVETIAGSGARVEFALKLPGAVDGGAPVWMPIDAKFPKEQYERLVEAAERADADGVALAGRELERAVRGEAKTIAEKYLAPPHTTDFAILFLPTEGLYAEVMRRPGLADELQRTVRVSIAGPSTLSALLNSLQMGFRTLALEKRSSEVWQVLGAVKTEFTKFGDVLSNTRLALEKAAKNIETAEMRSRQMSRKLKSVEALPSEAAQLLLGSEDGAAADLG
jgi:DNA recombination protein RmuC